ncbi:MAG: putative zinc-binding protein [Thermodesulfobacteriota bacterium]
MKLPQIGLLICNSGSSNSGALTGAAALEVVKELDGEQVGICSLPALFHEIPRQVATVRNLKHLIVIDGCRNECAKKVAEKLSLAKDHYLNLEDNLKITKLGPFSTWSYTLEDVRKVKEAILERIGQLREKE